MASSVGNKVLIKTFETRNLTMARGLFHKYNTMDFYSATIAKKEGGDNTYIYVVQIFSHKVQLNNHLN